MTQGPSIHLESLSTPDLLNLLRNSRLKGNEVTAAQVERVLESRRLGRPRLEVDRSSPPHLSPARRQGATVLRRGRPFVAATVVMALSLFASTLGTDRAPPHPPRLYLHEALSVPESSPLDPEAPSAAPQAQISKPARRTTPQRQVASLRQAGPVASVARPPELSAPVAVEPPAPHGYGTMLAMSSSPGLGPRSCEGQDSPSAQLLCEDADKAGRRARQGDLTPEVRATPLRHPDPSGAARPR